MVLHTPAGTNANAQVEQVAPAQPWSQLHDGARFAPNAHEPCPLQLCSAVQLAWLHSAPVKPGLQTHCGSPAELTVHVVELPEQVRPSPSTGQTGVWHALPDHSGCPLSVVQTQTPWKQPPLPEQP